jgi:hypothetical protein
MGNSFTMFIDTGYSYDERKAIGLAAIRYIKERSQSGKGIGDKPFGKYSKNYIRTRDFKIAKEGETKVNLTLTGDMLDSMEVLDASVAGRVVIGFQDGPESDKSIYMEDKGYAFLGLEADEIETILADFSEPSASLRDIVKSLLDVG